MKRLLLVDDNRKYVAIMEEYFGNMSYRIDIAESAAAGWELFLRHEIKYYQVIVTDITMESQLAGIFMLSKIHRKQYPGTVIVASTGFDVPAVISLSRLLLKFYGIDYLVRKTTILNKAPEFWSMRFFTEPSTEFQEVN